MKGINTYDTFWRSIFKKIRKTIQKDAKYERNQYIWHFLGINFQENPGKRQWRYVALCGAIFWTLENDEKMPNMKGINTYGTFWRSIFKKIRKTIKKMPNMKGINTYGTFG